MKFDVLNRWTGRVQFTAEIDCGEDTARGVKLGLAVRWARENGANLNAANLRDADLSGADLSGADLSVADLSAADLRSADLRDADLNAANLNAANLRGADLSGADLSVADLSGADLRDADLSGANLSVADLSGANLSDADLSGANLSVADLSGANLSGANLSVANLSGVPVIPKIHQAVYAAASSDGALDMTQWHCGSAHCRAGWVVTLAGDAGRAMEWRLGTPAAAALIYLASDPHMERIPDFYSDNETALADMKHLAELEATQPTEPTS